MEHFPIYLGRILTKCQWSSLDSDSSSNSTYQSSQTAKKLQTSESFYQFANIETIFLLNRTVKFPSNKYHKKCWSQPDT